MMKRLLIIISSVFLLSCSLSNITSNKLLCRHTAIICAIAYTDLTGLESRIVVGNQIIGSRVYRTRWHAQAQGQNINKKWDYLVLNNNLVKFGEQDNFRPIYYVDTLKYIGMLYYK